MNTHHPNVGDLPWHHSKPTMYTVLAVGAVLAVLVMLANLPKEIGLFFTEKVVPYEFCASSAFLLALGYLFLLVRWQDETAYNGRTTLIAMLASGPLSILVALLFYAVLAGMFIGQEAYETGFWFWKSTEYRPVYTNALYAWMNETATIAGPVEEAAKFIALLCVPPVRRAITDRKTGLCYAVTCALGFAMIENVLYFQAAGDLLYYRANPSHMVFSSMWGAAYGAWVANKSSAIRFRRLLWAAFLGILLHSTWNGFASLNPAIFLCLFALVTWLGLEFIYTVLRFQDPSDEVLTPAKNRLAWGIGVLVVGVLITFSSAAGLLVVALGIAMIIASRQTTHTQQEQPMTAQPIHPSISQLHPQPPPQSQSQPQPALLSPTPAADNAQTTACPLCGETILSVAIKCKHCGSMLGEPGNPPQAESHTAPPSIQAPVPPQTVQAVPANVPVAPVSSVPAAVSPATSTQLQLWNPRATVFWSLLFTPMFGAWLNALNWRILGDPVRAKASMRWVYFGIPLYVAAFSFLGIRICLPYLIFWLTWALVSARHQTDYVKASVGTQYVKRSWGKPIALAVVALVVFFIVICFIIGCVRGRRWRSTIAILGVPIRPR